jgi:hypothetical protein
MFAIAGLALGDRASESRADRPRHPVGKPSLVKSRLSPSATSDVIYRCGAGPCDCVHPDEEALSGTVRRAPSSAYLPGGGEALPHGSLDLSSPHDPLEREAALVAETVVGMPEPTADVSHPRAMPRPSVLRSGDRSLSSAPGASLEGVVRQGLSGQAVSIDPSTRAFMETRLAYDFADVRLHTDSAAAESAQTLNASAYTFGNEIVFGAGRYRPDTEHGRRLLAHELAHVVQQGHVPQESQVQRDCDDPNFCTRYPTPAEAASTKSWMQTYYLPVEQVKFGTESRLLYQSYLSRHHGDSLDPVEFSNPGSELVKSFAESWATDDDQDAIIDLIGERLDRAPGPLSDYTMTTMSVENFLSRPELDNRPINYSNPFSIAGHIAGGIGSSDAGNDYRKVLWGNATLEKVPVIGSTGYVSVETTLHYEVFDAVDFCPGDCGSPAEQLITVPMSRLEASDEAYDVPFKVTFVPESRSKRFWY